MMKLRRVVQATGIAGALLCATIGAIAAQDAMRVYYANDPVGRNVISIESRAPLETILTRTSAVTGEIHVNPANVLDHPQATFTVDLNTLDTGIAMRNGHMKSAMWLDTEKFPTATFVLDGDTARVFRQLKKAPAEPHIYTLNEQGLQISGTGQMTLHGVTKTVPVVVSIEATPGSDATQHRLPGDIVHVRTTFEIKLSDFGIKVPPMAQAEVADTQTVTADIFTSTELPKAPAQ